ncbi:MAG TPA: hypothetical protein VG900_12935 [Hyphomicrobiaceae bacterium]|nr:hypothetical protein [Hyphomicrobiaceae bacterium]
MPTMRLRSSLAMPLAAAAYTAAALLAPARPQAQASACNWYADMALKQQQRNEQGNCGLNGPEWNRNRNAHFTWCLTQPPQRWKAEARKREHLLAACKH